MKKGKNAMKRERVSFELQGKKIEIETGKLAKQADGAAFVTCGENRVLVTVVSSKKESDMDFFPLTVEYMEKFSSVGKIPGGYFKREGRPSNETILNCRLIDRPIRPCFPDSYNYETQIVVHVLSYDGLFPAHSLASLGASAALHISDIPFLGPIAAFQIARISEKGEKKLVLSPSFDQMSQSDMSLLVAGHATGILMVEGQARSVSEEEVLEALKFCHEAMKPALEAQEALREKTGQKEKRPAPIVEEPGDSFKQAMEGFISPKIEEAFQIKEKKARQDALSQVYKEAEDKLFQPEETEKTKEISFQKGENDSLSFEKFYQWNKAKETHSKKRSKALLSLFEEKKSQWLRKKILEKGLRVDGRSLEEIRPIECEVALLPRAHGSALFTRGETQVLSTVTLGTQDDEQFIDSLEGLLKKRFMLHYNFPPFCVGEVGRLGGQSRREIGHGFLAENALRALIPKQDQFPYVVRLVSEVLESNGSSSMGTVCSAILALMDAGVPIQENVAGIAMGLIKEGDEVRILSDILGDEDHLGDMDFKVAGSRKGITALQMDIKVKGIDFDVIEKALKQAKEGRLFILEKMEAVLDKPRQDISKYAPKIVQIRVKPEKVKDVIGAGGKVVKGIIEKTGVRINIEDDGLIYLSSIHSPSVDRAIKMIKDISAEAEPGKVYKGKVTKITDFGAFIEILPNTNGLLHISEIAHKRIRHVSDIIKEGEELDVKVLEVDRSGRIRLSRKALLPPPSR